MEQRTLIRDQLDDKMINFQSAASVVPPSSGWIYAIRYSLNMSLRQLGHRLSITPQSVKEIEKREEAGTVSLKVLRQVAAALNMKFVYGFIPVEQSLQGMIDKRATEMAKMIVERASLHMSLEGQKVSDERLKRSIEMRAIEIAEKAPKMLWD